MVAALASFLVCHSARIKVGSSIASIYARDAVASRNGMRTLAAISGDRFVLGLGVSHPPMVEGFRGHQYAKPLSTMRAYLDAMAAGEADAGTWPVALAALGPRMLELAGERTRGALPAVAVGAALEDVAAEALRGGVGSHQAQQGQGERQARRSGPRSRPSATRSRGGSTSPSDTRPQSEWPARPSGSWRPRASSTVGSTSTSEAGSS